MFETLTDLIEQGGYAGILLLTFIETVFPPIPSELFMPMAGFVAARGELTLAGVIAAGTLGSLAGAWAWYALGRAIGLDRMRDLARRHGRWLTFRPADVDRGMRWFDKHGGKVVLFGRMLPGLRSIVSVPAGIARMSPARFLVFSGIGSFLWTSLLMTAGYLLQGDYERVAAWAGPVSNLVIAAAVGTYLWRLATWRRGH